MLDFWQTSKPLMTVAADEQGQEKQGKKDFLGQILQMDYFTHTVAQPKHLLIFCHARQVFVTVTSTQGWGFNEK